MKVNRLTGSVLTTAQRMKEKRKKVFLNCRRDVVALLWLYWIKISKCGLKEMKNEIEMLASSEKIHQNLI